MWKFLNWKKNDELTNLKNTAFISLGIGGVVLVTFVVMVLINNKPSANFNNELTQTVGVFIGGIVPVFISIATVLLIYITFKSNREEFKKISEANNFQQFNTTFDSMCNTLIGVIEEYKKEQIFESIVVESMSEIKKYLIKRDKNKIESNFKIRDDRFEVFDKEFSAFELDDELIKIVESLDFDDFEVQLKIFKSGIILLFEHLEGNLNSKNLKENKEYYIYRIKKILSNIKLRQAIFLISINDEKLKDFSLNYDITENCFDSISLRYLVDKDGSKEVKDYKFPIMGYYN